MIQGLGLSDWGSTIAVDPGIAPELGGTLRIGFAKNIDSDRFSGATFNLFDWGSTLDITNVFDSIQLSSGPQWDLSQHYTTGEVTLNNVPEPLGATLALLALPTAAPCRRQRQGTVRLRVSHP